MQPYPLLQVAPFADLLPSTVRPSITGSHSVRELSRTYRRAKSSASILTKFIGLRTICARSARYHRWQRCTGRSRLDKLPKRRVKRGQSRKTLLRSNVVKKTLVKPRPGTAAAGHMDLVEPPAMACSLNSSPSKILATSITHRTKARNMHHVPREDTPPFEQAYTTVGSPRTRLSTRMTCMRQTPNSKKKTRTSLHRPLKFLQSWRIPDEAR